MRHHTTLRFIDAIARAGSIRQAADHLSITPSALNRRLLAVEEELDAPLFERLTTGVRLSAAGELFVAHARRQLADMERVRSQIEDMKGARRGHVVVGYDGSLATSVLDSALSNYRGDHPDVSFEIERLDHGQLSKGLGDYRFDLAGIVGGLAHPSFLSLATAPLEVCAVMRSAHPLAEREQVTFNDLLNFPLVLPTQGALRGMLDSGARRQDYNLYPVMQCELALAHGTICHGDVVGFQINLAARGDATLPGTVKVGISLRDIPPPYLHLMQLRGRSLSVAAGRFADRIVHLFAQYSGEI